MKMEIATFRVCVFRRLDVGKAGKRTVNVVDDLDNGRCPKLGVAREALRCRIPNDDAILT
ncbi:hypothetical protein [Noviherbaspirillum malthae]|jgi:hypothetical protein|uniref:hypothetical protein n=1 Tax=Noviherbaspirillum malthae TaxID=1260987 RepID=UPI0018900B7C|nr:hypothetical protein [Noviherbaspirillum malthae]